MKALALVESPDHVCCRYRIRAFAPALEAVGVDLRVEGLAKGVWPVIDNSGRSRTLRSCFFSASCCRRGSWG